MTPNLSDLPPPPHGKTGWPWTVETPPPAAGLKVWPSISIVTPSYNQAAFLEETIRSVLLQGYPNLEYVVIDGGSTDGSVEIIRKYERWLAFWVSEKDRGQSHAINKGMSRCKGGDILAYINSDDGYFPGAFFAAASCFEEGEKRLLVSPIQLRHADGSTQDLPARVKYQLDLMLFAEQIVWQQGVFIPQKTLEAIGPFDETLHFSFDHEFFLKCIAQQENCALIPMTTAFYRFHGDSKTVMQAIEFSRENALILTRFAARFPGSRSKLYLKKADFFNASYVVNKSFEIRCSKGRKAARIFCLREIFRNPRLLTHRPVVSAMVRFLCGGLNPFSSRRSDPR